MSVPVCVVVPLHDGAPWIQRCLASVGEAAEVVVVDNASTDGGPELARSLAPRVRLIANPSNWGFAAACNRGVAASSAPLVLFLNQDACLLPGALEALCRFMEDTPDAGAVGPRQWIDEALVWQWSVVPPPPRVGSLLLGPLARRGLVRAPLDHEARIRWRIWFEDEPVEVPRLSGGCLMVRRRAFESVGGFDEGYFLFFEDVDVSDRLRAGRWRLFALPSAGAIHHVGGGRTSWAEAHLATSGRRYLRARGRPLAAAVWEKRVRWRARRAGRTSTVPQEGRTLDWDAAPGASHRLELSADPLFSFGAAAVWGSPPCPLPKALSPITAGRVIYWRVATPRQEGWEWSGLRRCPIGARGERDDRGSGVAVCGCG